MCAWCVMRVRVLGSRGLCVFAFGCLGGRVRFRVWRGAVGLFCACLWGVWVAFVVFVSWAFWLVRSALALCLGCVWRSDERVSPSVACACAAFLARPSAVSLVLVPLCVSSLRRLCCCGCSCLALALARLAVLVQRVRRPPWLGRGYGACALRGVRMSLTLSTSTCGGVEGNSNSIQYDIQG